MGAVALTRRDRLRSMNRRGAPRILTVVAVLTLVASIIGFVATLILNAFVFDEYDAYGEVPIPGSGSVHLPAGDVTVTFRAYVVGGADGGLPVPPLKYEIVAAEGVSTPELTEDYGTTTTVNNDARVRIGYLRVESEGDYDVTLDGSVGAYLSPRLAFGHGSPHGSVPIVFAALFGFAVVDLVIARIWASRVKEPPTAPYQPPQSFTPSEDGIRIQQIETLARLRDSGALTQKEYESEKRRVLDGR